MNLFYWALVVILVASAGAYKVITSDSGVCQVPQSTTFRVFR